MSDMYGIDFALSGLGYDWGLPFVGLSPTLIDYALSGLYYK